MRPVLEKLFRSRAESANTSQRSAVRYESESETPSASGKVSGLKSEKVARTFDSIGRRNEALRAQLDSIECSFQNIEAIRAHFHDALTPIDQTLGEIERTKVAQLEAERKLESLSAAHERLKGDRAELSVERDALASAQDKLLARVADLEGMVMAAEAASSEAHSTLVEQNAKLERMERELEDNRRGLHAASEQLPAFRAEFAAKDNRLQEVERQRATLNDCCDLLTQENATLRMRIEEFVANTSKLRRQLTDLKDQRDELKRRLEKVETSFGQEKTAHATLKAAHLDAMEAQRLSEANLQEKFVATTTRLEAAERLLSEARAGLHEQDAAIRDFEQQALEKSLAAKSLEAQIADLEKALASARAIHVEVEVARAAAVEQSATLAKSLRDKEVALQRAEQKIATLEATVGEHKTATNGERTLFEEKIDKLTEQLEAESAARLFAEGALQTAREERIARRQDGDDVASPNEALSVGIIEGLAREFALLPEFSADLARAHASVAASRKGQEEFRLDKGESEPSLSYSADVGVIFRRRLEISATELVWKGCVYRFEEMVHLRWGQRSMFGLWIGAPYVILVKTPSRCAIIRLKSAETFGAVVDRLWQSVGVRLLYEYVEQLKKGGRIAFPGVIIEDDAVTFVPRKLFGAREEATLSWDEVRALSTDHCLIIRTKGDNDRRAVLSYVKTDNIRVIEHMIGLLLASGKPSISALLG